MESIIIFMQIIALACLSTLCIYLIIILVRLRVVITEFGRDFKELSSKVTPVFENLEVITNRVKHISENIEEQVTAVKYLFQSIRDIADNMISFGNRVQAKIEEPVMETVSFLAGFIKGLRSVIDRLRG